MVRTKPNYITSELLNIQIKWNVKVVLVLYAPIINVTCSKCVQYAGVDPGGPWGPRPP